MSPKTTVIYWLGQQVYRAFFALFGGVRVFGRANLPSSGGFLICPNHSSLLDPPAVGVAFPSLIGYVAKKELFRIPILSWLIKALPIVPVDRSRLGKSTLDGIARMLRAGIPVLVFPEGTRSKTGLLARGKAGIGLLAREMAVPLVPTYVHGTRHWPRTWNATHRISVTFGVPISSEWVAEAATRGTGYQEIADRIMCEIQILRDGHLATLVVHLAAVQTGDAVQLAFTPERANLNRKGGTR